MEKQPQQTRKVKHDRPICARCQDPNIVQKARRQLPLQAVRVRQRERELKRGPGRVLTVFALRLPYRREYLDGLPDEAHPF